MNISIFLLVLIVPITIFLISAFLKYPNDLEGIDKKRAIDEYKSTIGLDFYFIGLSTSIAVTIAVYGVSIPQIITISLILYALISAIVASLITRPQVEGKPNLGFLIGFIAGLIPVLAAAYACLFIL